MTTVQIYFSGYEAAMDKSFLESCGIGAYLADDCSMSAGLGSFAGPLRLQVDESDVEAAVALLAHKREAPLPDDFVPPPKTDETAPVPANRDSVWWWVILLLGGTFAALLILSPPSTQHRHHRPMRSTFDPWAPFTR